MKNRDCWITLTEAAQIAHDLIYELHAKDPNHKCFDWAGLLNGKEEVDCFVDQTELGFALDHILIMIHLSDINFPKELMLEIHKIADSFSYDNYYSKENLVTLTVDELSEIYNSPLEEELEVVNMERIIIYGDIHGCCKEFKMLREKVSPTFNDAECCVGDIITRGDDSIKTLDYILKHNILSVVGNHEDKIIRYLHHEQSEKKNPIILDEDEQQIVKHLTKEHIDFLESLPIFKRFNNITILHGGIHKRINLRYLKKRDKQQIIRIRYLDKNENFVMFGKEDETSTYWADLYNGNHGFIVYGHQWFKEPRVNEHALGIDLGCVYGNKLCAAIFTLDTDNTYIFDSFVTVPSKTEL